MITASPENCGDQTAPPNIVNSNVKITHQLSVQVVVIVVALIIIVLGLGAALGYTLSRMATLESNSNDQKAEIIGALRDAKVAEDLRKFSMEEARIAAMIASSIAQANLAATKCRGM